MSIMKNTGLHTSRIEVGAITSLDELICEHADNHAYLFPILRQQQIKYLSCR